MDTSLPASHDPRLDAAVRRVAAAKDMPAFGRVVGELQSQLKSASASVPKVTRIILKDVALTTKLLRLVNSAYYNRSGVPIASVSHAVVMLGWNAVGNLATGVLLFENLKRGTADVKERMMLSLLAAHHANELAAKVGYPRIEEAYLCGLFHGLGELLVAYGLPEEHEALMREVKAHGLGEDEACVKVLGFGFHDLGAAMARTWGLPDKVTETVRVAPVAGAGKEHVQLHSIARFSHELSIATYRDTPEAGARRLAKLLEEHKGFGLDDKRVQAVVQKAVEETRADLEAAGVSLRSLSLEKRLAEVLGTATPAPAKVQSPEAVRHAELVRLADDVDAALRAGEQLDLNDAVTMTLEVFFRGLGADRALFCLVNPERTHVVARMALGEGSEELSKRFHLSIAGESGPVAAALRLRQDVFADDVAKSPYAASELVRATQARGFAICPLVVDEVVIGAFYVDRVAEPIVVSRDARRRIGATRTACAKHLESLQIRRKTVRREAPPATAITYHQRRLGAPSEVTPVAAPAPVAGLPQPGQLFADRYRIEAQIGRGGMATVYRAADVELGEIVALKVFAASLEDPNLLARFRQEIALSRVLQHPNIPRLYDLGSVGDRRYITMELLSGADLTSRMGAPVPLAEGLGWLAQVCAALAHAHERGIVHRDVKPANLFLTTDGVVKLMDFGIAKRQAAQGITIQGTIAGTPEYMSPEQIQGFETVTGATDLYALGVVAYQCFTGRVPFKHAEMVPLLMLHVNQAPPPPRSLNPQIPLELEALILRLLEKDPAARPADAGEVASALAAIGR